MNHPSHEIIHPDWTNFSTVLSAPFGWVHLSGPPGQGKTSFVRWLQQLDNDRVHFVLDLAEPTSTAGLPIGIGFQICLGDALAAAGLSSTLRDKLLREQDRSTEDQIENGWAVLADVGTSLAKSSGKRPVVVLDGLDMVLWNSSARRALTRHLKTWTAREAFDVLTTSVLSLKSLKNTLGVTGLGEAKELKMRLLDAHSDAQFVFGLSISENRKHSALSKLLQDTGGRLRAIYEAISAIPTGESLADTVDFLPVSVATGEAPKVRDAQISPLPLKPPNSGAEYTEMLSKMAQFLSIQSKSSEVSNSEWTPLAEDFGWISGEQTQTTLPILLKSAAKSIDLTEIANALKNRGDDLMAKERHEQSNADLLMVRLENIVKEKFCRSEVGLSRNTELLSDRSHCIQRGRHYSFSLKADDIAPEQSFVLKVFPNLSSSGADLLDIEMLMLRQLSDERHVALPTFYGGGRLGSIDAPDLGFSYLMNIVDGAPLREPPQIAPGEFGERLKAVTLLSEALTRLHRKGIFHRRVILSNILRKSVETDPVSGETALRFVLTGFEFAQYVNPVYSGINPLDQVEGMQDVMTSPYDILCCPPEYMSDATTAPGVPLPDLIAQSDVFGMAMIASMLLNGAPDREHVEAVRDAPNNGKLEAIIIFLESYTQSIKDNERLPEDLRRLLIEGLSIDVEDRPDASAFSSRLNDIESDAPRPNVDDSRKQMLVVYDKARSARELQNSGHIPVSADRNDAILLADDFVRNFFRNARLIRFDSSGYTRFVSEPTGIERDAKIVVIGQSHAAYCKLFVKDMRSSTREELHWALSLRRIVDRRQFGTVLKESVPIPFPYEMVEVFDENSEAFQSLLSDGDPLGWVSWNKHIEAARKLSEVDDRRKAAFTAWEFANKAQEKLATLRLPGVVSEDAGGRKSAIILDAVAFRKLQQQDEFIDLLFRSSGANKLEDFFSQFISNWLDENVDSGGQLFFLPQRDPTMKSGDRSGDRVPLGDDLVVGYGRLIVNEHSRLKGSGQLVFQQRFSPVSEILIKSRIIQDVLAGSQLFEQLDRPHPRVLVEREMQVGLKERLTKGRSAEIVERMVNSEPFFALQGPPGTGKSTALAEYVHAVLDHSPLTRILLTSQSHVAVDVLLDKVTELVERRSDDNPIVIARVVPNINPGRLTRKALSHSLDQIVGDRVKRIRDQAKTRSLLANDKRQQAAWARIHSLPYEEMDRRIRNGVSLLFCTTSASRHQIADQQSSEAEDFKFDVAVVEEAGRADASDLLVPLIQAPRQIIIGDHKQLPAFSEQRLTALLETASEIYKTQTFRSGASEHVFADIGTDFDAVKSWLNPFRRMFDLREKAENEAKETSLASSSGSAIPASAAFSNRVIDTLDMQFRSHPDIGSMISRTFYESKVVNSGDNDEWAPRLLFDKIDQETKPLTWIDTSGMFEGEFIERIEDAGKTLNLGEARVVGELIEKFSFDLDLQQTGKRLRSQLLFMSPYKGQVGLIEAELRNRGRKLLLGSSPDQQGRNDKEIENTFNRRIKSIVSTVDASQGSEADLVVISFARSRKTYEREPTSGSAAPSDWEWAIHRNFGFISDPRRINVMLSRARSQVVVVGNLENFETLSNWIQNWADSCLRPDLGNEYRERSKKILATHGFWGKLIQEFDRNGAIIPAEKVLKA